MDLEHLGATQITGDPGQVAAACHTMAVELATSRAADIIEVICVGFGHDLEHLERVIAVDTLSDVIAAVEQ